MQNHHQNGNLTEMETQHKTDRNIHVKGQEKFIKMGGENWQGKKPLK